LARKHNARRIKSATATATATIIILDPFDPPSATCGCVMAASLVTRATDGAVKTVTPVPDRRDVVADAVSSSVANLETSVSAAASLVAAISTETFTDAAESVTCT